MRLLDRLDAWHDRAEHEIADLSSWIPNAVLEVLLDWPLVTAPLAEMQTGGSRASAQRHLAWMEERELVIEVTGLKRFRAWRIKAQPSKRGSRIKEKHLAYCKWSDNNGYCDVYVDGDLKRGWTTRVATTRYAEGRPLDWASQIQKGLYDHASSGGVAKAAAEVRARCETWEKENPKIPIDHKDAGEEFKHTNPRDCAVNLERLKADGLAVPQRVIKELRDEADWYEQCGTDLPE